MEFLEKFRSHMCNMNESSTDASSVDTSSVNTFSVNTSSVDRSSVNRFSTDERYMAYALELAKQAIGNTYPNPLVGAVIVKDGEIIGAGYHEQAGKAHAEVNAINDAKSRGIDLKGSTLYVTLEPCCHKGKTPPCCDLIVESGISKVVVGVEDPFPLVKGKGIERLVKSGLEVLIGVLPEPCTLLNEVFFTNVRENLPFVTLKSAMSLDGKIGTYTGESKWITNVTSRQDGHELRRINEVIAVGVGTVLADNPELSYRKLKTESEFNDVKQFKQPHVFILDTHCKTPSTSKLFKVPNRKVYVVVSEDHDTERATELRSAGATIVIGKTERRNIDPTIRAAKTEQGNTEPTIMATKTELRDGEKLSISLDDVLRIIKDEGYSSVLVEGGSQVVASFIEKKLFHKMITYIGDIIIGGTSAIPAVGGVGFPSLNESIKLDFQSVELLHNNIKIVAYPRKDGD